MTRRTETIVVPPLPHHWYSPAANRRDNGEAYASDPCGSCGHTLRQPWHLNITRAIIQPEPAYNPEAAHARETSR
jgi:hypothetical protein